MAKSKKAGGNQKVVISLPDNVYADLVKISLEEIRSIPNQARFLMEIGMQLMADQKIQAAIGDMMGPQEEGPGCDECASAERPAAIGFHVPSPGEIEEEDEESEDRNKRKRRK